MHIIVRHIGQFIVIDVFHIRNVQPACGHVRGDQHCHLAVLEPFDGAVALALAFVAMDGCRVKTCLYQRFHQLFTAMFGAPKDQRPLALVLGQKFDQQRCLFRLGDKVHLLRDLVRGFARRGHFDANGPVQIGIGNLVHQLGHGCRKQHRLAFLWDHRRDFAQIVDEPHVQHLVGFVQHQKRCFAQVHGAAVHQIQQTARCGHQHVNAAFQAFDLWIDRHTAHNHLRLEW